MRSFTSASLSQVLRTLYDSILSGLFLLGERGREEEVVKEALASLILNHESSVFDTTAKEASLSIATGSNGSWASTWFRVFAEITDVRLQPGFSGFQQLYGSSTRLLVTARLPVATWLLVAAQLRVATWWQL